MDSQTATPANDQGFLREAALIAWKQCLRENGLMGAMGCAHLAPEAAKAFVAEFNKSLGEQP
jgi:hypothetical protein